jgi:hypothetical protein
MEREREVGGPTRSPHQYAEDAKAGVVQDVDDGDDVWEFTRN